MTRGQSDGGAARQGDVERALAAAQRWRRCAPEREARGQALRSGHHVVADSPARLAKWVRRRQAWAAVLADQHGVPAPALARSGSPVRSEDVDDRLVERVQGMTRDLLSIEFFELGLLAARCVGRVMTHGEANGTGFLVAPGLMLTNEHVLPDVQTAASSEFDLDYEDNKVGPAKPVQVFALEPERFFLADVDLDFALVGVALTAFSGAELDAFKSLPLIGDEGKVRIGEAVNIVQHPGGRAKQVVVRNNRLVDLPEGHDVRRFFHYEADTEQGSSGSPVFNDFWEVVALHHTAVPKTNERGELLGRDGQVLLDDDPRHFDWVANEGIRVSRIVEAVTSADLSPAMAEVRATALRTWELRGRPSMATGAAATPSVVQDDPPAAATSSPGAEPQDLAGSADHGREALTASAPAAPRTARLGGTASDGVVLELDIPLRVQISLRGTP